MGLLSFLSKAGGWVKDKFHKVANFAGKAYNFAAPIVSKFMKVAPMVSGKIGALAGAGRGILDAAKGFISVLPDSGIKNKLNSLADKGGSFIDSTQGAAQTGWNTIQKHVDTGQRIYDAGKQAIGTVSGIGDRLRNGS
jgi:hypothetical protein